MNERLQSFAHAAAEAASAPMVKASSVGTGIAGAATPFAPAAIELALASLAFTALTFLVNAWAVYRKDKRDERLTLLRESRVLRGSKTDTDISDLDEKP